MQLIRSDWVAMTAVFTLTLEKYTVTAENQTTVVNSTISFDDFNVAVTDVNGTVADLTSADFTITSLDPEIVSCENGVFTAKASGTARICIDYKGCKTYMTIAVLGNVYNVTTDMIESVGNGWGGSVTARDDGKLIYNGQAWASAIALKDDAFASVKEMAATYGYNKLVVTLYSADQPNIINIFAEGKLSINTANVNGNAVFTENDAPIRYEIDYATFKDWTAMQLIRSDWVAMTAVFTLTLEKYAVTAENQYVTTGSTLDFAALNVEVTDVNGVVANLTYADFTITSLNTDVVTYANGVFTAQADGKAVVRIEYKGSVTYITISSLNATKVNLADIMTMAGLTYWYAPEATLTDLGGGRLKIDNPTQNNNCGWQLTGDQLALVREIAAKFGYNKLTIEVYANPDGVLAAQGGSVAGNFPDKGFFWQVGGSVITTEATDENPIVGTPRDDIFAADMVAYWDTVTVGVHGIGSIEFSLFLEKV